MPLTMPPADVLHALSLTSLAGYLAGWPLRRLAPSRLPALRFVLFGAPAGGGLLWQAGWPGPVALGFGLAGGALAALGAGLVGRASATPAPASPSPASSSPALSSPASSSAPAVDVPAGADAPEGPPVRDTLRSDPPAVNDDPLLDDTEVSAGSPPSPVPAAPTDPAPGVAAGGPGHPTERAPAAQEGVGPPAAITEPAPGDAAAPSADDPTEDALSEDDPTDTGAELWDPRSNSSTPIDAPAVVAHGCRRCGVDNRPEARFCKGCSAPLVPWTCERCGERNDVDATFCERCREPLPLLASPLDVEAEDDG